jgi:hypothetical protein
MSKNIKYNVALSIFLNRGNIIKYACRLGRKDDERVEATKIKRYAKWLLDAVDGKTIDPRKE